MFEAPNPKAVRGSTKENGLGKSRGRLAFSLKSESIELSCNHSLVLELLRRKKLELHIGWPCGHADEPRDQLASQVRIRSRKELELHKELRLHMVLAQHKQLERHKELAQHKQLELAQHMELEHKQGLEQRNGWPCEHADEPRDQLV